jgi:predicted dehydrogenase
MSERLVPFAIIGAGGFGLLHIEIMRRLEEAGRLRLVAVADPFADQLPIKQTLQAKGVRFYEDYEDLLAREQEIRAVVISTPVPYHYRMARAALARGIHVYLEKPPVPLIDLLEDLIALDKHGHLLVGFQNIGAAWMQHLKELANGPLGHLTELRVQATWLRSTAYYQRAGWAGKMAHHGEPVFDGPATNAISHLVHNVMYLAGEGRHGFAIPETVHGELYRARRIESHDIAVFGGVFPGGARFSAALSHAGEAHRPFILEMKGTRGWARFTEDTAAVESSHGRHQFDLDGHKTMTETYLRILAHLDGDPRRPYTSPEEVRGYVLGTNAMLVSSGGIHTIGEEWVTRHQTESGEFIGARHLDEVLDRASGEAAPWGITPTPVRIADLDAAAVRAHFPAKLPLPEFAVPSPMPS